MLRAEPKWVHTLLNEAALGLQGEEAPGCSVGAWRRSLLIIVSGYLSGRCDTRPGSPDKLC